MRELQLDLSDSVFGPLPLDELSDLTPDRYHHVEEILVGLSDLAAEEVDDAQYFAAEQNGKGERRMQSFTRRDRRAGKRRTLLCTEVGKVEWLPAPPDCTRQPDPGLERGRARFGFKFRNLNGFFMPHLDATEYARLLVHRPKRSHVPYQVFTDSPEYSWCDFLETRRRRQYLRDGMLCQEAELLITLPLGGIAGYFRGSDHVSGIVSDRRDGERNVDLPPVFVPPHGFIVFKRFASPDSFEDPRLLVDEARGISIVIG